MGNSYNQLSLRERIEIEIWHDQGRSARWIAQRLARSGSTISRELKRNSKPTKQWHGAYQGARADGLAHRRRRWDARHKLARQPHLRAVVRDRLAMGWSPEQIAGRLALDSSDMTISAESIYRYCYHRSAQKDYWHRLLPRAKHRRGRLRRGGLSPVQTIKARQSIHTRSPAVHQRTSLGHWEADLMLFRTYGQAVLAIHERVSRLTILVRQPSKAAQPVLDTLTSLLSGLPAGLRQTITFDNGTEFALHYRLTERLGIHTFFCDPHAPWQKGRRGKRHRTIAPRPAAKSGPGQHHPGRPNRAGQTL
jgi:IS30 family transposase